MSKHTPGPWLREGNFIYVLTQDGWRKGEPRMVNRFTISVQQGRNSSAEEIAAVAALAHAAPEMCALLKEICGPTGFQNLTIGPGSAHERIAAAIARAEGRTP